MVPFVASRILSGALLVTMARLQYRSTVLSGFSRWDGRWYLWIAQHSYTPVPHVPHHQSAWPFFPLLPAAIRTLGAVGLPAVPAAIIVNHVALFVALVGVHRIAMRHISSRGASLAIWIMALSPLSFVFSMVYPSAIFIAASVWAFLLVEEGRDLAGGAAAAAAALARPNGAIVAVVLVFAVKFAWPRVLRIATPTLAMLAAWMLYNHAHTGDAFRYFNAKQAWREVTIVSFVERPTPNAAFHLASAVVMLGLVVAARRNLPRSWLWYSAVYLIPSLALGLIGAARYATELFPPFVAAGHWLEKRRSTTTIALTLGGLVTTQAVCAYIFIGQGRLI